MAGRKDKPIYTPHLDCGDYVIVKNASKVVMTGRKSTDKEYQDFSGWVDGLKRTTADVMREKHPEELILRAVWGMMPHGKLGRAQFRKLKVYGGEEGLVGLLQGAGDSMAQCAGLTDHAAAGDNGVDVKIRHLASQDQRLLDESADRLGGEEIIERALVDSDLAGAGGHADTGAGALATTYGQNHIASFWHSVLSFLQGG